MSESYAISGDKNGGQTNGYVARAKKLLDIRNCEENIIAVQGFDSPENVVIPLAAFIEWATSNWTGNLGILFPKVSEAWSALEGVETFFSLSRSLIERIDKDKRQFQVGNKLFRVCSSRTKEADDIDISGGLFVYNVLNTSKICDMYRRVNKSNAHKIISVRSNGWLYCVHNQGSIESKVARVFNSPFIDPVHPKYFPLLPPDEQKALMKQRASLGRSGYSHMQGLYWAIAEWESQNRGLHQVCVN